MTKTLALAGMIVLAATAVGLSQGSQAANESLWEAAREGDSARITAALSQGADVNAKARYDVTPLIFAASNGRLEVVKLLVARGADVNAQDSFYRARAADMAGANGHSDVVIYLLQNGADGDGILVAGVQANQDALVKAAVAGKVTRQGLQAAINLAGVLKRDALVPVIKAALDARPAEAAAPAFIVDPATLARYAGDYREAGRRDQQIACNRLLPARLIPCSCAAKMSGMKRISIAPIAARWLREVSILPCSRSDKSFD